MFPPKTADRVRLIKANQRPSMVKNRPVTSPHTTVANPPMARTKQKTNKKMSSNMVPRPSPHIGFFGSSIDHDGHLKSNGTGKTLCSSDEYGLFDPYSVN